MTLPGRLRSALSSTAAVLIVGLGAACVADDPGGTDGAVSPIEGEVVLEGLAGPTQLTIDDDGAWWLAQLAGRENEGQGQVIRLDPDDPSAPPEPTGVALFAGELWSWNGID